MRSVSKASSAFLKVLRLTVLKLFSHGNQQGIIAELVNHPGNPLGYLKDLALALISKDRRKTRAHLLQTMVDVLAGPGKIRDAPGTG